MSSTIDTAYGIHWFRRDLRVAGNPALEWNWKTHSGSVLGFFCFDPQFLARPDFSPNRFAFFLDSLLALREELRSIGGDLLVLDKGPDAAFSELFETIKQGRGKLPQSVSFNRDYEPFARERDKRVSDLLSKRYGVQTHTERDHLLIEPDELSPQGSDRGFYQVYTPFARRWFELLKTERVKQRIHHQRKGLDYLRNKIKGKLKPLFNLSWTKLLGQNSQLCDKLTQYQTENAARVNVPIPQAGSVAAIGRLQDFCNTSLLAYKEKRDFPAEAGTSRLSYFFKNGSLSNAQVLASLPLDDLDFNSKDGLTTFVKELAWREFYYHILYHRPEVEQHAFLSKYESLQWENNEKWFQAWCAGNTGFPIVDAGMRELNTTGFMHNRVRMIVASFLTKDLLIDWRWGERYFMQKLLDGDLAPNNGGWQWAASTGCDPQPYFRIFNPLLQSEKFDKEGAYIKCYVPELNALSAADIHEPTSAQRGSAYPSPIVDHAEQRHKALRLYSGD